MSSTSDSIVNLANGGFACVTYHIIGVCLSSFACRPATASCSSGSVIGNRALCAGYFSVAGQHCCSSLGLLCGFCGEVASPSCVCFIYFGFLLATICVWVWMVCSLHSVTTGSRDRANNVSLIIESSLDRPGLLSPTHDQHSQQQIGQIRFNQF